MSDGEQGPKAIFLGVRSTALTRNELEEKTKQEGREGGLNRRKEYL